MSYNRKNLNLQEESGETFNIALDENKTILTNSKGPVELVTERLCIKSGAAGDCFDVVNTINLNSVAIDTEVSDRGAAISTETSSRTEAINSVIVARTAALSSEVVARGIAINDAKDELDGKINDETAARTAALSTEVSTRTAALSTEASTRSVAINTESVNRVSSINSVIARVDSDKATSDDNKSALSLEISTAQSSINGILANADINLDSFKEIVEAYENADSGLQGFINTLTSRLDTVEGILNALTEEPTVEVPTLPAQTFSTREEAGDYAMTIIPDDAESSVIGWFVGAHNMWYLYNSIVEGNTEVASIAYIAYLQAVLENLSGLASTEYNPMRKAAEICEWAALDAALQHLQNTTADEYRTSVLDPAHAEAENNNTVWPIPADPQTLYSIATYAHRDYFRFVEHDGASINDIYYMLNPS